jgi:hypothetical protein
MFGRPVRMPRNAEFSICREPRVGATVVVFLGGGLVVGGFYFLDYYEKPAPFAATLLFIAAAVVLISQVSTLMGQTVLAADKQGIWLRTGPLDVRYLTWDEVTAVDLGTWYKDGDWYAAQQTGRKSKPSYDYYLRVFPLHYQAVFADLTYLATLCEGTPYMLKIGYKEIGDNEEFVPRLDLDRDKDQVIKGLNEVLPAGMKVGPAAEIKESE